MDGAVCNNDHDDLLVQQRCLDVFGDLFDVRTGHIFHLYCRQFLGDEARATLVNLLRNCEEYVIVGLSEGLARGADAIVRAVPISCPRDELTLLAVALVALSV